MNTLVVAAALLVLMLPAASPLVPPDPANLTTRDANRAIILGDLPSFNPADAATMFLTDAGTTQATAAEALEQQLDFLDANGIDLRDQAAQVDSSWPLLYRVRIDESGDRAYAPVGETLACPVPQPLNEPLPSTFQTIWPAAYPNIPPAVRSTLFLPPPDARAQWATSRISFFMNPDGDGASATSFTPGDDPNDPVDLQRTIRYQDTAVTFGPISKMSCFTTRDIQGRVVTARLTAIVNGIANNQPFPQTTA